MNRKFFKDDNSSKKLSRKKMYLLQILNFLFSIFVLWIQPFLLIIYLVCFNFYLKYLRELTKLQLFLAWVPILIFWYFVLLIGLANHCPLMIGPGHTEQFIVQVSFYDPIDPRWCEKICVNTIILLDQLSCFLDCTITLNFPKIF